MTTKKYQIILVAGNNDFGFQHQTGKGAGVRMALNWTRLTDTEWDAIPPPRPKQKPSAYDDIVAAIIDGEIVGIPVADEKEVRGKRIAIARRANSAHGVRLRFKYDAANNILAVRLSEMSARDDSQPKRPVGRPKKSAQYP